MQKQLLAHYIRMNLPPVSALATLYILAQTGVSTAVMATPAWFGYGLLGLAVLMAIVVPTAIRLAFAGYARRQEQVLPVRYKRYRRRFISAAAATPYLTIFLFITQVPDTLWYTALFLLLYELYIYFPTMRSIRREYKIFHVKPST